MTFPLCEKLLGKPRVVFGSPSSEHEVGWFYYAEDLEKVLERAPVVEAGWHEAKGGGHARTDLWSTMWEGTATHSARLLLIEEIKPKDTAEDLLKTLVGYFTEDWWKTNNSQIDHVVGRARKFLEGVK